MIFSSLQEGLHYYTECTMCLSSMKIENIGFNRINSQSGNDLGYTLIFSLDYDDKLIINPVTEEIIIDLNKFYDISQGNDNSPKLTCKSLIDYNGVMFQSIHIACSGCSFFSYTLSLEIDLHYPMLTKTSLSNIKICIKENNKTHEIANYYGTKKTFYTILDINGKLKSVGIPMIDINIDNPTESLKRIRKLIIFT